MNLKTLADKLTTELTGVLSYDVTDDTQHFSNDMRLGGDKYVPCVISLLTSFVSSNKYSSISTYQITFKVALDSVDNFYTDMLAFRQDQADEVIGTNYVSKVTYQEVYQSEQTENGITYKEFTVDLIWTYSLSVVGSQAIIKIDNVAVPFLSCNVVHDKAYTSNQDAGSNYRMTNDIVTLEIPLILSNTKVLAIYGAVNSNSYNQEYDLNIDGATKTVVLKQGQYTIVRDGSLSSMILLLETAYPRVAITLDGVLLPLSAYQYSGKLIAKDGKKNSTDNVLRSHATSKVRSWSITFVKDDSATYDKVEADAYGVAINTTYSLIRDGVTYTLIMVDSKEEYTETGDMALQCQFIEYGAV